jgi:hypothetical protein
VSGDLKTDDRLLVAGGGASGSIQSGGGGGSSYGGQGPSDAISIRSESPNQKPEVVITFTIPKRLPRPIVTG